MMIKGYHFPDRVWTKDEETGLYSSHEPTQADVERRKASAATWKENSRMRDEAEAEEELG